MVYIQPKKETYSLQDRIVVEVLIVNKSPQIQSFDFSLYKKSYFNFDLQSQLQFSSTEHSFEYLAWKHYRLRDKNSTQKQRHYKMISLDYGESFKMELSLNDFFNFKEPGRYFIKGNFLFNQSLEEFFVPIPEMVIYIDDNVDEYAISQKSQFAGNSDDSLPKDISFLPNDVVERYLLAEINRDWENHFQTIHLPSYLENSYTTTEIYERYQFAIPREKNVILSEFKEFIIKNNDYFIKNHEIVETVIQKKIAYVKVFLQVRERVYSRHLHRDLTVNWIHKPNDNISLDKTLYLTLKKIGNYWKIVAKDVVLYKDQESLFKSQDSYSEKFLNQQTVTNISYQGYQILFDYGKYLINTQYFAMLEGLSDFLKQNLSYHLILIGYSDINGDDDFNFTLSRKRAEAVSDFLITREIKKDRIKIIAKGNQEALPTNNKELQKLDRKVVMILK